MTRCIVELTWLNWFRNSYISLKTLNLWGSKELPGAQFSLKKTLVNIATYHVLLNSLNFNVHATYHIELN